MTYRVRLFHFFSAIRDHILRIKEAEKFTNVWKNSILLIILSAFIYGWMGYLGIGSNLLSGGIVYLDEATYASSKLWFMIGRIVYGALFAAVILFIPSFIYRVITFIPYQKLVIMQMVVLVVLLLERIIWIPLAVYFGLDWYTSPLSFGIIASYLTDTTWYIYFFGAISLFQIWTIWFQFRFLSTLSNTIHSLLWISIILIHVLGWTIAGTVALGDTHMISGWFE